MTLTNIYANLYFARNKKFSIFIIIRENIEIDYIYREKIIIFLKAEKSLRFWSILKENKISKSWCIKTILFLKKFFLKRIFNIYYSREQPKIVSKNVSKNFLFSFFSILKTSKKNNLTFLYLNTYIYIYIHMMRFFYFFCKIYFSVLYIDLVVILNIF